jgi:hypothetical protein
MFEVVIQLDDVIFRPFLYFADFIIPFYFGGCLLPSPLRYDRIDL